MPMYVFALTSLLASVVVAFLGGHVFYRNPRGALNRVFAAFCLVGSYASLYRVRIPPGRQRCGGLFLDDSRRRVALCALFGSAFCSAAGFVVECLFIGYAMLRHGLFALTLATAAEGIISTMMDALFLVDTGERIVTINQAALDLLGYEEGELIGQSIAMFLEAGDGSGFQETHLSQLVAAGSLRDAEVVAKTRHAGRVPLSLSGSIMRDENSVEQGIIYVGRDLTERKRVEEQVRASLM
jgi:PAS domain S-box-containing protein